MDENTIRELTKVLMALRWCQKHFKAEGLMNAALHMSEVVLPAPLAANTDHAVLTLERILESTIHDSDSPS
jgi:hypothetical protein